MNKQKQKKTGNPAGGGDNDSLMRAEKEKRLDILTGVILFAFGVYQSILYFGHTVVPISDFPDLYKVGSDLLAGHRPARFLQAPVLGLLQNFLYPIAWGPSRELTAGWLLNAIVYPLNLLLFWLIGRKIIGKAAVWIAVIFIINPWTIYLLTEPIIETTYLFFILLSFYLIFIRSRWAYLAAATATMVRYEGAALIFAAFVADIIHRNGRRDVIRAFILAFLASVPLIIWLLCTALTWQSGQIHYLTTIFKGAYSKGFGEPTSNRTGIFLGLQALWRTGFACLSMPSPGTSGDTADMIYTLNKTLVVTGFALGFVFSIIRRQWQVWMLFLFLVPYFILHAYYPFQLPRFYFIIMWIVMLVCFFGLQSIWRLIRDKWGMPGVIATVLQIIVALTAVFWLVGLAPYLSKAASVSPRSVAIPYLAIAVVIIIIAARFYIEKISRVSHLYREVLPRALTVLAVMSFVIVSNQFGLASVIGDGLKEYEFRQLGEWFAANGGPGEKIVVYNSGPAQLFAGKNAVNIVGFPKADNPKQLAEKLRADNVTYITWTTREGTTKQHPDYQLLGLDKNIPFLSKPRDIGCYEFVRQIGSNRGFINIFRLKDSGEDQLPAQ
jgi:hypothetical protein